jgi:putrescine transport system ATP-binding protein
MPASATQRDFLRIEGLTKDFDGYKAVNNVSLDIAKGEIFALLGSSGCGKSTLLRMLAGFETPTSGRILLDGKDMAALPPYERPVNMMFQSYALFPHLTVEENIAFGLKRDGMAGAKVAERVDAMLKLVQLGKFAKRRISSRAASSSAWRWRAAWPSSLRCCFSTSRSAHSTRSCARKRRSNLSTSSSRSA